MLNDDASNHALDARNPQDASDASTTIRRGRGRPLGSLNKPKPPPMSLRERQALKDELGAVYRQAIIDRALVETRTRGVTSLIQAKLGKECLAEIQAEVVRDNEATLLAGEAQPHGLAA